MLRCGAAARPSAPNTLKRNAPWGVVVSICSVSERKATPTRSGNRRVGHRRAPAAGPDDHRVPHWPCRHTAAADPLLRRATHRVAGPLSVGRCHWRPAYSLPACPENSSVLVSVRFPNPTGFVEQILAGLAGGVKAPRPGVGKHLILGYLHPLSAFPPFR